MITLENFSTGCPILRAGLGHITAKNASKNTLSVVPDVDKISKYFSSIVEQLPDEISNLFKDSDLTKVLTQQPQLIHRILDTMLCQGCEHNVPYHPQEFRLGQANCVPSPQRGGTLLVMLGTMNESRRIT